MRSAIVLILLLLGGCSAVVADPVDGSVMAKCYGGLLNGFCVVAAPHGTSVVGGSGIIPTGVAAVVIPGLLAK